MLATRWNSVGDLSNATSRVEDIVDDGERVKQPSYEVEMVIGLRDRLDCIGGVATKPRPDLLVAPEILLEKGLAVLDVAAKRLGEPNGVVEIEISTSISN